MANGAMTRVRRVSAIMRGLCTAGIVAVPVVLAAVWLTIDAFRASWPLIAGIPNLPPTLSPGTRAVGFLVSMIPGGITIYSLARLRRLFGLYAGGAIFAPAAARCLRGFAWAVIVLGATGPLTTALMSVSLTYANPPGQRSLSISLGSDDLTAVFLGLLLLVIAWIMGEAARVAEDNAQIV